MKPSIFESAFNFVVVLTLIVLSPLTMKGAQDKRDARVHITTANSIVDNCSSWRTCNIIRQGLVVVSPSGKEVAHLQSATEDFAMCPSWSPDHSRIAYCLSSGWPTTPVYKLERAKDGIYIKSMAKLAPIRLTYGADKEPSWSPDGKRVAYVRVSNKNSTSIEILNIATRKRLTFEKSTCINETPTWSPDGLRIAFSSNRTGHYKIWVKKIGDTKVSCLPNQPSGDCRFPAWSSRDVLLMCCQSDNSAEASINLYLISPRGANLRKVRLKNLVMGHMAWSPDGHKLVYVGWTAREAVALYITNALGSDVRKVHPRFGLENSDYWPDW